MTPTELNRFMSNSFHDREWNGLWRTLLSTINQKDIMCLDVFLTHPKGQDLFTADVVQKMGGTQWDEGWAHLVEASMSRPQQILSCLRTLRADTNRFEALLQKIWDFYAGASKKSARYTFDEILLGVMSLAVEYSDESLFDRSLQRLSLTANPADLFNYEVIDCAINNSSLWALKKIMAHTKEPSYVVLRWIVSFQTHSLLPAEDLRDLVETAFHQDPKNSAFLPKALNAVFPWYDDSFLPRAGRSSKNILKVCREIDALCVQHNFDRSEYRSEIFTKMAQAYCEGDVSAKEAIYWCNTVWNQRVTHPSSGAGSLNSMLGMAVYASVQSNRWEVVKSLRAAFAESFDIVLASTLKTHVFKGDLMDKIVDQIDGDLLRSVVQRAQSTPKIDALRQKFLLSDAVAGDLPAKKTKRKM